MDELISREALLADIERDIENSGCVNHEREIMDCIRYAPTVAAELVRHAAWEIENIPDEDDNGKPFMVTFSRCSVCGKRVYFNFERTKYCSDCGARMDLEPATEKEDSNA